MSNKVSAEVGNVPELLPLDGCTDPSACNYDPLATIDDGSCLYLASNDLCENAIDVTSFINNGIVTGEITGCGNIDPWNNCPGSSGSGPFYAIWYSFIFSGGDLTIQVTPVGGTLNPRFIVYDACNGATVACQYSNSGGVQTQSLDCSDMVAGAEYVLGVGGRYNTTGTFDLTLTSSPDIILPVFLGSTLPADTLVNCPEIPAVANVQASDDCGWVNITLSEEVYNDNGCTYELIRTWTAYDFAGNSVSHAQFIWVEDTTPPFFNETLPPQYLVVSCDSIPSVPVLTPTDNCDDNVEMWFVEDIPHGDAPCLWDGPIERTWTIFDDCGNSFFFQQSIWVEDTESPTFIEELPPQYLVVSCDSIPSAPVLTPTDNCDEDVEMSFVENIPGEIPCLWSGPMVRTWTLLDDCGNSSFFQQFVWAEDTIPAVFDQVLEDTLYVSCDQVFPPQSLSVTDNCLPVPSLFFSQDSIPGNTDFEYTLVREWSSWDGCGNQTIETQVVIVGDYTAPNMLCENISVTLDNNGEANVLVDEVDGGSFDTCSLIDSLYLDLDTFHCSDIGIVNVILSAIDSVGNIGTCISEIMVTGVFGCTDNEACDFNPLATCDSGICDYSCICLGDFNFDGIRNTADLLIFLSVFGCLSNCENDLNGDDIINTQDLLLFLSVFGLPC